MVVKNIDIKRLYGRFDCKAEYRVFICEEIK